MGLLKMLSMSNLTSFDFASNWTVDGLYSDFFAAQLIIQLKI